jgi:DNA replication protein DnaC
VVDAIGYFAHPAHRRGAFFQLMNRRYEHVSTTLTSHKGFAERGEVFGDDVMAATLIDLP